MTAASAPSLLAYNVSPSPTFLNQALAFALWAGFVLVSKPTAPWRATTLQGPLPLQAALAILLAAAIWSMTAGGLPASLGWSSVATLLATMVLVAGGAAARASDLSAAGGVSNSNSNSSNNNNNNNNNNNKRDQLFAAFCWAWVIAGGLNLLVALIQVFWPDLPDAEGRWIAHSGFPGRAVGNLRQPNHLSSLLLWSCIAVIGLLELQRLRRSLAAVLLAALVFAVVLTASRTGLVSVVLLALWGIADRRLSRRARVLLIAAPLLYAASWLVMAQWAALSEHSFGGSQRLAESDISGSRFAIWRDTLTLIAQQPWAGVGFGEFNFAWTLTPLPQRPVAFFDHTHNLLLQLAVELGLPLALLVMGLLVWGLWRGWRNAWAPVDAAPGAAGPSQAGQQDSQSNVAQRCAMLVVLMIGLHSMLEYPLWYSYFLLPAAWAWGYGLMPGKRASGTGALTPAFTRGAGEGARAQAGAAAPAVARPEWALRVAAVVVVAGAALAVLDFMRVAAIFQADDSLPPLQQRIASGQRSVFFAHHADYAAVTSGVALTDPVQAFGRATHFLLDTRLMMAWARSLAGQGELDAARHLAARLREFRKTETGAFFDACPDAAGPVVPTLPLVNQPPSLAVASTAAPAPPAFQCQRPLNDPGWRYFLAH